MFCSKDKGYWIFLAKSCNLLVVFMETAKKKELEETLKEETPFSGV